MKNEYMDKGQGHHKKMCEMITYINDLVAILEVRRGFRLPAKINFECKKFDVLAMA